MKKLSPLVVAALFVLSAFLFVSGGTPAQAADDDIYKTLNYKQIFDLMQKFGYTVTLRSDNKDDIEPFSDDETIVWHLEGNISLINIGDNGRRVEFYIYLETENADVLQRTNTWNKNHFYARAHVDKDGDPVLEFELDTTGGVTEARIHDFFKTCLMSLQSWRKDVVD